MNNERQKIIDKVIKLLALSEGTNHSAEAEAAKNMAAELMAKYDIAIEESKEPPEYETREDEQNRTKLRPFDRKLVGSVAKFNGVAFIIKQGRAGRPWVDNDKRNAKNIMVGRKVDLQAYDYMIAIIRQQRALAWKTRMKELRSEYGEAIDVNSVKRPWFNGFSLGVAQKLNELTRMKETKIEEKGLVPVSQALQAINKYEEDNGKCGSFRSKPVSHDQAGVDAGKNVSIHKGIEAQGKTLLIS